MSLIIDGKTIAASIRESLALEVNELRSQGVLPCLAVVIVGDDPASQVYVRNKKAACEKVRIESIGYNLSSQTTEKNLISLVKKLNANSKVNGILIQLPLPAHINEAKVIETIDPSKDVDGFHPINVGRLITGEKGFVPCTPLAIMALIDSVGCEIRGKRAVVIGRSNIVGKPIAALLLARHATVTICHSRTVDLPESVRRADIVVVAIGKPKFVKGDWIKKGAVVIDVGINRMEDGKMVGDVDFDDAKNKCYAISPVPGGVGPMTIAMLLKNVVEAAKKQSDCHL